MEKNVFYKILANFNYLLISQSRFPEFGIRDDERFPIWGHNKNQYLQQPNLIKIHLHNIRTISNKENL